MHELLAELSRIQEAHNGAANYEKTLALLRALKAGTVTLDQVTLAEGGWNVAPPADQKALVPEMLLARADALPAAGNGDGHE